MIKRFRRMWNEDRGAALALVGTMLVVIMGMAAFGSDLAWFYLNASRVQRTADAASLGGVVWMPGDFGTASSTALDIALQNGYDDTLADVIVTPAMVPDEVNQLQVTVTDDVPTFFLKVLGFNTMTITRSAIAEYIPPLKLGSPANKFGNDPSCYGSNSDCAGNFWANMHGTRTDTGMGDAYSSFCDLNDGSDDSCAMNPNYRTTGYLYGIDPGGAGTVTLQTLDMRFHYEEAVANGDWHRTGDHNNFCGAYAAPDTCVGPTVTVKVFEPDPTPLDLTDNGPAVCTKVYDPTAQVDPDSDPPFTGPPPPNWVWDTVCDIPTGSQPNGIWVVQIVNTVGDENHSGLNRYSIRTSTGNLFALGDFSIYNNATGSTTSFYLAEVPDYYKGKTFVIEMYDTGESADPGDLEVIDPTGFVSDDHRECRIYSKDHDDADYPGTPMVTIPNGSDCFENVAPKEYHGRWLKFEIDLPTNYTCTDCWWKMNYDYSSGVNDTTTWKAYMIGNPIHLVSGP